MSGNGEKGKFDTNISQDVIEEALRAVRKHRDPEAADVPVEVEPVEGSERAAASQKELEELRAQLEFSMAKGRELMDKLKDQHEKMLRAAADLDNFKKRAQKEKDELQKYGAEKLLKAFLPVIDNLDRAIEHAKSPSDFQSFVQGVAMTRKLFEDTLGKNGARPFSAMGQTFDPRMHEAMQQVERDDVPANQVVAELMRGFMLNDRLLRPALVMVARPTAGGTASTAAGTEASTSSVAAAASTAPSSEAASAAASSTAESQTEAPTSASTPEGGSEGST